MRVVFCVTRTPVTPLRCIRHDRDSLLAPSKGNQHGQYINDSGVVSSVHRA